MALLCKWPAQEIPFARNSLHSNVLQTIVSAQHFSVDLVVNILHIHAMTTKRNTTKGGNMRMKKCICKRCGYKWTSKTANPKSCPACKSYQWDKKAVTK